MEIWKDIVGYEGLYQVSNLGNVKSLNYRRSWNEYCLTKILDSKGYFIVNLYNKGIQKTKKVHQLVAEAFLNHKTCGYELVVNHKNFIRNDNRLENLEVITTRENTNKKHLQSSSDYIGVYYDKSKNKWRSNICINEKQMSLGTFDTELEASKYYENALKAQLNNKEIIVKFPNFTSNYKGVYWSSSIKKWISTIYVNGKKKQLGRFVNEIDAYKAIVNKKALLL